MQQAFLYESTPTLHTGIPALEVLHKTWSNRASRTKYAHFSTALKFALEKIEEYYKKTSTSYAYTFTMCKLIYYFFNQATELQYI